MNTKGLETNTQTIERLTRERDAEKARADKAEAESAEARGNVSKALAELGEQVKLRLKAESELAKRVGVIDDFIVACGFNVNDGFELNSRRINSLREALIRIRDFPVHSEPVGGAYNMQDIAEAALAETEDRK